MNEGVTMKTSLLFCLVLLLAAAGCSDSGSSGDKVLDDPPADVEGEWTLTPVNADTATLTNCTGPAAQLEGLTMALYGSTAVVCTTTDPFMVSLTGNDLTFASQVFNCADATGYTASGTGTIQGDVIEATLVRNWSFPLTDRGLYDGLVTSDTTLTLMQYALEMSVTPFIQGGCDIVPPLEIDVTISP
jgi:hypothetical protein